MTQWVLRLGLSTGSQAAHWPAGPPTLEVQETVHQGGNGGPENKTQSCSLPSISPNTRDPNRASANHGFVGLVRRALEADTPQPSTWLCPLSWSRAGERGSDGAQGP